MLGIDMQVGELGLTPLIAHVFALALLIIFLRDGNTAYSRPHEGLRRLILGKIFFGVMLSML
ncbi:MAG: hypothetical protein QXD32_07405, partial [Nitrososphaerota archaeon]